MKVVGQKSDCKSLLQGEPACAWRTLHVLPPACRTSGRTFPLRDQTVLCCLPPLSFPTLCVEWRSLALADVKIEFLTGGTLLYVLVGLSGGSCWRREGAVSWLHFNSCFGFVCLFVFYSEPPWQRPLPFINENLHACVHILMACSH